MKLEAGKTYVTRAGGRVKIGAIDLGASKYHQAVGWRDGLVSGWSADGAFTNIDLDDMNIVAEVPTEEPSAVDLLGCSLPVVGTLNFDNPRRAIGDE